MHPLRSPSSYRIGSAIFSRQSAGLTCTTPFQSCNHNASTRRRHASGGRKKIKVKNPVVELDGDEVRYASGDWQSTCEVNCMKQHADDSNWNNADDEDNMAGDQRQSTQDHSRLVSCADYRWQFIHP